MNVAKLPILGDSLTNVLSHTPDRSPAIGEPSVSLLNPLLQSSWQGMSGASAIAFIDASVSDYQTLVAGIAPGTEVHILDSSQDAITQITNTLLGRHNISSLHIVSHGEAGGLDFGSSRLNLKDLPEYAAQLQSWSNALTDDADLLLYGCNVAEGELGKAFTSILSQLTGADVAASDDLTGRTSKGGNWTLEYQTGSIETGLAFTQPARDAYTGTLVFAAPTNLAVGANPYGIATGDFNGDGKADLAVSNYSANSVSIRLGNGNGTFTSAANVSTTANPLSIVTGDFNGDGITDFAVTSDSSPTVSVRLGTGTGTFTNAADITTPSTSQGIVIGDFNSDGKADLAIASTSSTVAIRLGTGNGTFTSAANVAAVPSLGLTLGDFNSDGKADLAIANFNSTNVAIRLGTGNGTFTSAADVTLAGTTWSIAAGDFNGDGKADFATGNTNSNTVFVRLGTGNGTFTSVADVTIGAGAYGITIADFNGDGKADFATSNQSGSVSIRLGNGSGGFTIDSDVSVPGAYYTLTTGLFDADSLPDIATANFDSNTVSVLLNRSNAVPVLTVSGAAASYTENGLATALDTTATVTDTDSANFDTGTLTVSYSANGTVDDRLVINNQGTGAGQIGVSGSNVTYGGVTLGTFTGGTGTTPLVITFNATATAAAATALLRSLTYTNVSENPSSAPRTVQLVMTDGDGGTSTAVTKTINVTAINDTTYTVTNTNDSGVGSLRQAILDANTDPGTEDILFNLGTGAQTIALASALPFFTGSVNVLNTTGANNLTIQANGQGLSDIFTVNGGVTASFDGLQLVNAIDGIRNAGILTVNNSLFSNNRTSGGGAGVSNTGTIALINNSTFTGGFFGVYNTAAITTIQNSTFAANTDSGIRNISGATITTINNSTIANNAIGILNGGTITNLTNSLLANTTNLSGNGVSNASGTRVFNSLANAGLDSTLQLNGGSTPTYALLPGSAAIDAAVTGATTTDQRGIATVNTTRDVGAFESRGFNIAVTGGNTQNTNTGTAFTTPLAVNVTSSFGETVTGGTVTFTPPGSGASATVTSNPATLDASGNATVTATANSSSGGYTVNAGGGGFATPATFALTNNNVAPIVTFPGAATLSYAENDTALLLDSTATLTDTDSPDFSGGLISASLTAGGDASDRLEIRNQGTGVGQIAIAGNLIGYNSGSGPVTIGSFTGGTDGSSPLVISLNAAATTQAVRDLIRNLTYRNVSEDPTSTPRTVSVTLNDGDGGTSAAVTKTINVTANNDAPVVTVPGVLNNITASNPAAISIPASGNATPYGSPITVSGLSGNVTKATVTLSGMTHSFSSDEIDILLVSPTGESVILMSDVNGSLSNNTFTFDDAAAISLPGGIKTNGTYRPTNVGTGDSFGAPAPSSGYGSTLSVFNGVNPNGTWQLYVVDDTNDDDGSIAGGWSLTLSTPGGAGAASALEDTPLVFSTVNSNAISISDLDAGTNPVQVSLTATNGTITLGGTTGLTGLTGNGSSTIGFSGSLTDINAALQGLTFASALNVNGAGAIAISVNDQGNSGGTAQTGNGSVNITITPVNDAPQGTNRTVTALEDSFYAFTVADFGFSDPIDTPANSLQAVQISTTPTAGSLTNNGVAISAGDFIAVAAITGGQLRFTPTSNANGAGYASFTFRVQDDGGTANSGLDTDLTARTMTVNVTPVNDVPQGTSKTVTTLEDTAYVFSNADFGFSDPTDTPANSLLAVRITTLPSNGSLTNNGAAVAAGDFVSATAITSGQLQYLPATHANGTGYANFTFQVQDNGGTANSGIDLDPTPRTLTVNVTPVNDAPQGTNQTVTISEDATRTFTTADFGFSDPNDTPANGLQAVQISTLPTNGTLTNNSVAVTAGQVISAIDIAGGLLTFTPAANANGTGYSSFTFRVQDDGVTTNGGVNTDLTARTMTLDVTAVNDAPSFTKGADQTVNEDAIAQSITWATSLSAGPANESSQTLSFLVSNSNNALFTVQPAIDASGNLTYTPVANASGTATVTVRLQDNGGTLPGVDTSAAQTFTITVNPVNDIPSFTKGADQTSNEDAGVQTLSWATNIFAGSADESGQTLSFEVSNSNNTLFAAQPTVDATGNLTYTAATNANGTATVTVQLKDNGGTANSGVDTSLAQSFAITVNAVNDAPSFTPGANQTASAGSGAKTIANWATAFNPGATNEASQTALAYTIVTVSDTSLFTQNGQPAIAPNGTLTYTPVAAIATATTATISVRVQDNGGTANTGVDTSTIQTFTITVNPVNNQPSFTATNPPASLEDGGVRTIPFATFNPGDATESAQTPTYTVSNVSNAALFAVAPTIAADGTLTYTAAPNAFGTSTFAAVVKDSGGTVNGGVDTSITQTFSLTVASVNDAPSLTGNATLAAVTQNSTNPSGSSLTSLFGSLFTDVDAGASLSGLAIVGNTADSTTQGRWQYSLDSTTWTNIGVVADGASALALAASTLVRFVPAARYQGTPPGLTVRALDNTYSGGLTTGTTPVTVDTTTNGGSTAIAGTTAALSTSVTPSLPQLVWQNSRTGQSAVWPLNGFTLQNSYFLPTVAEAGWQVASSTADFNQDGITDLLWRNQVTGSNSIWQLSSTGFQTGYFIPPVPDRNWQIAGTADLNRDGVTDIIWRNQASGENVIWQQNGATLQSSYFLPPVTEAGWQIVSTTADFNADGITDLLWRNQVTGANSIWQLTSTGGLQTGYFIPSVADRNWRIVGTGDFNRDGIADIVWRNNASGENAIWQVQGGTLQSVSFIRPVADPNWQIVGVSDLGGDATPELLWRNQAAGTAIIWQLNGFSYAQLYQLPNVPDPNWSVRPFVPALNPAAPPA